MQPADTLDPQLILDEWINRVQNLPEELRFLQEEIAHKDREYDKLIREIEDRDGRIQKWIKAHGSHHPNPKEDEYRATIAANFKRAEELAQEKIALTQKLQQTMDKHIRHLDMQIKMLYDRGEPGFTDPDELPSLIRPSDANVTNSTLRAVNGTNPVTAALTPLANGTQLRVISSQIRGAQSQQHISASAPATPAATMILNRQAREGSAGPSTKRAIGRSNSGLGNAPATSSGLARHSSLGPGTPKASTANTNVQRAGSAGPRATSKASGTVRKSGTPSASSSSRKKGTPTAGSSSNKSGLSRVKRAVAKNSPSSTAESELSDAVSASDDESDARTGGRGTPATVSRANSNLASFSSAAGAPDGSSGASGAGNADGNAGPSGADGSANGTGSPQQGGHTQGQQPPHHQRAGGGDDMMDVDEDEAGDDRKYCSCQNVSFGNMVACDNEDCPYEWFHWGCVGLKSEPNGTWYCPDCTEKLKKKGRTGGGS